MNKVEDGDNIKVLSIVVNVMNDREVNIKKSDKIILCAKYYLENEDYTIKDVAQVTGFSISSVQRYLNSNDIEVLLNVAIASYIKVKLNNQKIAARRLGGINSKNNNIWIKTDDGKFVGSCRKLA